MVKCDELTCVLFLSKSREPFDMQNKRLSGIEQTNPNLNWTDIKKQQKITLTSPTKPVSGQNWKDSDRELKNMINERKTSVKKK